MQKSPNTTWWRGVQRVCAATTAAALITSGVVTTSPWAQAEDTLGGLLFPEPLRSTTDFAPAHHTYRNPEGGRIWQTIRGGGFGNSSALFSTDRQASLSLSIRTRADRSYKRAYYMAGMVFGCQVGIGDPNVKLYIYANTKLTVNGKTSVVGRTEPLTDFVQQSVKTAVNVSIAAAECGSSEGSACPELAAALARELPPQIITTWNLQDLISTAAKVEGGLTSSPQMKMKYKQSFQSGRTTVLPFYLLRYSPGMNRVTMSGVGLRATGCVGVAKVRPFIRTFAQTRSGNYVDYSTYGDDYLLLPNKLFRMSN